MMKTAWFLCIVLSAPTLFAADVVENGRVPKGQMMTLEFNENLRLGGVDATEEFEEWAGAGVSVSVDDKGRIYVCDPDGYRILQFDKEGDFIRQIGKQGEGPGEFRTLTSFFLLDNGRGIAYENLQRLAVFNHFDLNGRYIENVKIPGGPIMIQNGVVQPNGEYLYVTYYRMGKPRYGKRTLTIGMMDKKTKTPLVLSEGVVDVFNFSRATEGAYWSEQLAQWSNMIAQGFGIIRFNEDSTFWAANTDEYKITKYSADLKPQMVITRDYKPLIMSDDMKEAVADDMLEEIHATMMTRLKEVVTPTVIRRAINQADTPPVRLPVNGLVPMEDGGLMVIHNHNRITKETVADLFNKSGEFIGQVELPKAVRIPIFSPMIGNPTRMLFKGGNFYTIQQDEEGLPAMVRYAYKLVPKEG